MPSLPDTVECTEVLYTDGLTPPRQLVFRGRIKGDEEDVCIKIFNLPEHLEVLDEMLQDLNFDFGVQSKVVNVQDARWVVMDYCDCSIGDVICLIKELSEEQIQAIAHGALIAMQALHSTGLAHTNVKPNNMLVQEGQLLLGDQGLTQLSTLRANPHPARVIPEGQDCFDMPPADVWALGMSIIEMADRIPPFHGLPEDEVERRLQEDRVPEMQSKRFDENAALQDFLARCLDLDPEERATCDELLAHPWLASVSIESSEDVFDSMVDSFKAALQEWYDANGKLVPRVQLRQLFDDQVAGALKSSSVTTDIPPTRLADPPAEGFTQIPLSLLPEEESEPVVLKDKTAGEFPLALPDTEARPQNYVIQNCSKVEVFLLGPNLNVVLQRVSNSTIFIGPCKGRVKLEGLDNCQVAVAAKRVEMERCRGVEFLSLYTEEPLRSVGCDLDTISLIPWHLAYPKQKDMMSLAGLNPFTNRWNEHETSDMSGDAGELRLLVDPYRLFHITAFPLPGMSGGGDPQQAVYLLKDVEAPVRPDDHDCIYISSLKQSRVVKRPGELEGRRVHIENSNRSEFLLLDSTSRVDLVNLNACQAVVGPTDHLELKGLVGCVVIAACAELKIVQCSEICIFLWCATPPIVANCVELELAYFNVSWPLLDKMVQQRGWDTMPNMYEHMRDASPRSSIEAKLHNKPMYRNIPILNETGDDFLAPINYPFDESNLQRDMTIADFDPVYGSTHRKTLDVAVKSISSDSFFDITMKSPTDYPERFKTQDHVAIRHVAHARILHLADTLPGNVSVETVDACEVYLLDATETVLLKGASNSTIVVGPVAGQLLIEQCKGCTIVGAASQIVVTGSTECRLSVWCSHDFIVHSSSVEVAPWNIVYPGLREQAVATFGEERLAMESRHTKVYDLSRDDVRFPEPHVLVYPLRDVRLEVLQVEDLEVSPFPFVPVPEPARVPGAESPAAGAANSPEPASPCSPEPAKVSSPNTLSYLSGERVERGMGELQGGAFEADHAERCEVVVADVSDSVTLSDCSDCSFVIGPSKGAVVLTNLSNCKVWCVCPEFSATGLVDCKVYLLSTAAPVFTQCSDTTLSPFNARLPKLPLLLEQAGIDPAVSAAHLPVLNDSSVAQPDYVGVLEMQSFVLQKSEHDQTESVPAIEQRLQPPVPQAEKITAPEPEVPEAPEKPEGGTSSPAGESVYGRARREALEGVNPSGPWDVAGVALPPQKRWEKSEVTATGVSFFKGKTVVVPDSDVKREQQVELNQLHDCRVVVIGSCGSYMIDDCTNCEFILGPCSGSMFFRDCADLCVTGACMQLRMRDVSTGDFFVHTETDPAVESSTNITLRPLNLKQPSLVTAFEESRLKATENRFRHAADFNTFSDPKATEGFKIPDWVGSLPMRSMEILGHGVVGVPDGVEDMLTGKIEGGESLEKGKSFAMGLSQEEAARMHRERQGLQDTEEPKQKEADSDSDLTLDSDMVSGKSSKKAAAELAVEAAPTPPPPVAAETPADDVPLGSNAYLRHTVMAQRKAASLGHQLEPAPAATEEQFLSALPRCKARAELDILHPTLRDALQQDAVVLAPPPGCLLGTPFDEREVDGQVVVIQGTSGGTVGVDYGAQRIYIDGCTGTDFYTTVADEVWLSNCTGCKIYTICNALHVYGVVDTELHVYVTSPPVFERSSGLAISPWSQAVEQTMLTPKLFDSVNHYDRPFDLSKPGLASSATGVISTSNAKLEGRLHYHLVAPGPDDVSPFLNKTYPRVGALEESKAAQVVIKEIQCKKTAPEPEVPEAPEKPEGGTSSPAGESVYGRARREALEGVNPSGPWDVAGVALPPQKRWEKSEVTATGVSFFKGKTVVVPDSDVKREQQVELNQLHDCRVVVIGSCGSYMIDDCTNCEFILGPCSGSMFFRDCADLCVTGACMQLRMRDVSTGDFFVHTETDPAVESSTNITLRPLNLKQPSLVTAFEESRLKATENRFRHAADFNTFSDPKATEGFKIPDWVGSLPMRSMEILGHGVVGVPDGVEDMLTGKIEGGESLEKGKSFAMGLSQEEAARMHRERQGLQDTEEPKQKEADSDSDLTLDSDMVSGKSSKKAAAELAVEAAPTPPPPVAAETPADDVPLGSNAYLRHTVMAQRKAASLGHQLEPAPAATEEQFLSALPRCKARAELDILHPTLRDALQQDAVVLAPPPGCLLGTPFDEREVDGQVVVIQGTSGGTVGVDYGAQRIYIDGCTGTDFYTTVADEVWLSNCTGCKIYTICNALHVYGVVDTELHVYVTSPPVFERSSGLAISPWSQAVEQTMLTPKLFDSVNHYDRPFDLSKPGLASSATGVISTSNAKLEGRLHYHLVAPGPDDVSPFLNKTYPRVGALEESKAAQVVIKEIQCKKTAPEPEVPEAPEKPEGGTSSPAGESVYGRARREALEGVNPSGPWDVAGVALPPQKRWEKSEVTATGVSFFKGKTVVVPDSDVKREQQVELNQLHDCRVVVIGSCGSYMIDDCTNCEFILGPCSGSMFFRDCADLCVTGACMQLRMRDVSTGDFFVHTETDPAVESSTNITLRPLNLKQPSLVTAFEESRLKATENRFRHAADFNTFSDPKATEGFKIPDWVGSLPMRSMEILGHGVVGVPDGVEDMLTGKIEGGESLEKGKSFAMGLSQEEAARMHRERQGLQDTEEPKQKEADSDSDLTLDSDMVSGKSSKKAAAELAVEAAPTPPPPAVESPPPAVPADTIDPRKLSTATSADGPADDSVDMRDNDSNLTLDSDLHSGRSSKRTMELSASNLVPPPVPVPGKPVAKLPGTILRRLVETPVTLPHAHKFTRGGEIEANLLRANEELVKVRSDLADIEGLESRVDALLAGLGLA